MTSSPCKFDIDGRRRRRGSVRFGSRAGALLHAAGFRSGNALYGDQLVNASRASPPPHRACAGCDDVYKHMLKQHKRARASFAQRAQTHPRRANKAEAGRANQANWRARRRLFAWQPGLVCARPLAGPSLVLAGRIRVPLRIVPRQGKKDQSTLATLLFGRCCATARHLLCICLFFEFAFCLFIFVFLFLSFSPLTAASHSNTYRCFPCCFVRFGSRPPFLALQPSDDLLPS